MRLERCAIPMGPESVYNSRVMPSAYPSAPRESRNSSERVNSPRIVAVELVGGRGASAVASCVNPPGYFTGNIWARAQAVLEEYPARNTS